MNKENAKAGPAVQGDDEPKELNAEEELGAPSQEPDDPDDPDGPDEPDDPDELDERGFDAVKARKRILKANSENRNLRKRAREAEAKAAATAESGERATALEAENLKLRVALKHGLPEELAARLQGGTEEELLEDAEKLMELFAPKGPPSQQSKPVFQSPSSRDRDEGDSIGDPNKFVASIFDK